MKGLKDAARHRRAGAPLRSTVQFARRFDHVPRGSVSALLRKAGPFIPSRDGYKFTNLPWAVTEEDARVLRARYQPLVGPVSVVGIGALRTALTGLGIPGPWGTVSLPVAAVDFVIEEVTDDLKNQLLDKLVSGATSRYGRCGGMAFSAYDFFLSGWRIPSDTVPPGSGILRTYIWDRLLDSLSLNARTFFEWIMVLHVLPTISTLASGALGAAAGSVIGGPLGAAVGAFIGGRSDVLGLGGRDDLLSKTRDHWARLRSKLDREAAWPIGFVYGGNASPIDQHEVLATAYEDRGDGTAKLTIWDNNDGAIPRDLKLDMRGDQLAVRSSNPKLHDIKGIICEEYGFQMPPAQLRR